MSVKIHNNIFSRQKQAQSIKYIVIIYLFIYKAIKEREEKWNGQNYR